MESTERIKVTFKGFVIMTICPEEETLGDVLGNLKSHLLENKYTIIKPRVELLDSEDRVIGDLTPRQTK